MTYFVTTIQFRPVLYAHREDTAAKGQLGRLKIFDRLLSRLNVEQDVNNAPRWDWSPVPACGLDRSEPVEQADRPWRGTISMKRCASTVAGSSPRWPLRQPDPERIVAEPCTLEVPVRTDLPNLVKTTEAASGAPREGSSSVQAPPTPVGPYPE